MESKNKKGYNVIQPLLLGLSMAVGIILGVKMEDKQHQMHWVQKVDNNIAPIGKVEEILRFIDDKYIDSIDQKHLIEVATKSILNELDPYSEYVKKNSAQSLEKSLNGLNEGIGIEEISYDDKYFVYKVYEQSSASEKGMKKGDQIFAFNGAKLSNESKGVERKNDWFRNAKIGEACQFTILRNFGKDTLTFDLTKNYGHFISPTSAYMLDDQTAYIKIDQFSKKSYRRFMSHYERMYEKESFNNLVIDIRNNTGGYVQDAINVINQFFKEKNKLLLTTIDKHGKETVYKSTGRSFFKNEKLVILIDEETASASEILASVIQDWDLGKVIGQASFGKGLIQEYFPMTNGDKLKLSISRYITPSGRRIFRDSLSIKEFGDIEHHSKKEKRLLKSGKVIPDIKLEPTPLEKLGLRNYIDAILDAYIFQKLYTDSDFATTLVQDQYPEYIEQTIIQEIKSYLTENASFSTKEKMEIQSLVKANFLKHTKGLDAYQTYKNSTDQYIEEAIRYFGTSMK